MEKRSFSIGTCINNKMKPNMCYMSTEQMKINKKFPSETIISFEYLFNQGFKYLIYFIKLILFIVGYNI